MRQPLFKTIFMALTLTSSTTGHFLEEPCDDDDMSGSAVPILQLQTITPDQMATSTIFTPLTDFGPVVVGTPIIPTVDFVTPTPINVDVPYPTEIFVSPTQITADTSTPSEQGGDSALTFTTEISITKSWSFENLVPDTPATTATATYWSAPDVYTTLTSTFSIDQHAPTITASSSLRTEPPVPVLTPTTSSPSMEMSSSISNGTMVNLNANPSLVYPTQYSFTNTTSTAGHTIVTEVYTIAGSLVTITFSGAVQTAPATLEAQQFYTATAVSLDVDVADKTIQIDTSTATSLYGEAVDSTVTISRVVTIYVTSTPINCGPGTVTVTVTVPSGANTVPTSNLANPLLSPILVGAWTSSTVIPSKSNQNLLPTQSSSSSSSPLVPIFHSSSPALLTRAILPMVGISLMITLIPFLSIF